MYIKDTVFGQNLVATLRQLGLFITVEVNVVPVRMLCHVEDPKRIQMKVVTVYHKTAARKNNSQLEEQFHQEQFSNLIINSKR